MENNTDVSSHANVLLQTYLTKIMLIFLLLLQTLEICIPLHAKSKELYTV